MQLWRAYDGFRVGVRSSLAGLWRSLGRIPAAVDAVSVGLPGADAGDVTSQNAVVRAA